MCFYNQYQFVCGDITRNLKHRCDRVYPQEISCGLETASEMIYLQSKCSRCNRILIYRRSQQREWDRIKVFESKEQVDDEAMQRSIGIINQLQDKILALELKRRNQRNTVSEDNTENHEKAGLGPAVELAPSTASTVTKVDYSAPLIELEDGYDEDDVSSRASASTARSIDARPVAEWKARRDNENPLAKSSLGKLAMDVTDILEQWLEKNSARLYPIPDEMQKLCLSTGLSMTQVEMIRPPCR